MEKLNNNVNEGNISLEYNEESSSYTCRNPWGESCLLLDFPKDCDISILDTITLPKRLIALKHTSCYEFIFQPWPDSQISELCSFDFVFAGETFRAEYREVSKAFELIARSIKRIQYEDTNYGNVFMFRSYFRDIDENNLKNEDEKEIIDYKAINFFLEGNFSALSEDDHFKLFRHVNFYMHYYNRHSPLIVLFDSNKGNEYKEFNESNLCKTPKVINSTIIDDTLLLLLESARDTQSIRLQYIFYYQVLEYCAYYYLDEQFKRKIHNIVENPSFFVDMDTSITTLIDAFQHNYNKKNDSDTQRLERVLSNYTNYDSIKNEIIANEEYFRNKCVFDGGYILDPLLGKSESIDTDSPNFYKSLRMKIENLRNVLVHVRESRESKCIAPTPKNSHLLKPYLYLIRRIAEELATRRL